LAKTDAGHLYLQFMAWHSTHRVPEFYVATTKPSFSSVPCICYLSIRRSDVSKLSKSIL